MAHRITRIQGEQVEFTPPTQGDRPVTRLNREKFGITDPALALVPGNEFEKGIPSNYITRFGEPLAHDTGPTPDIDRNPYNFVALAGKAPWRFEFTHGHDEFRELSGVLEFEAEALTPCFVPEGFPVTEGDRKPGGGEWSADDLRQIERRFCRMADAAGQTRYAIPGASFKGALRSAVEAVSNARFGVADDKSETAHVYRRRVFSTGVVRGPVDGTADCQVDLLEPSQYGGGSQTFDNRLGLLAAFGKGRPQAKTADPGSKSYRIPKELVGKYLKEVICHPHYEDHWAREKEKQKQGKEFYTGLNDRNWADNLPLRVDEPIYFTLDAGGREIANFGKNVNYLWPARRSMADLTRAFQPRQKGRLGDGQMDLAEYLFGMATAHERDESGNLVSEPFRGQLRFETLWGPPAESPTVLLNLAPLTSPQSKGKSRPLYLAPGTPPQYLSGSYDDPAAEARGRKFYWHQRPPDGNRLWVKHEFAGSAPADKELRSQMQSQCPAPLCALPAGAAFHGRIHFSNLHPVALGALLYALSGDGDPSHPWAFHLGKGKPRGMGSFRVTVSAIRAYSMSQRYRSLTRRSGAVDLLAKTPNLLAAFRDWCSVKGKLPKPPNQSKLTDHAHLADYAKMHTWPDHPAFRYYPLNFNQYSWLPGENDWQGEPKSPTRGGGSGLKFRPRGMRRARDVEP